MGVPPASGDEEAGDAATAREDGDGGDDLDPGKLVHAPDSFIPRTTVRERRPDEARRAPRNRSAAGRT
jgi:hypothetical protein